MPSPKIHVIDLEFQGKALAIFAFVVESEAGPILIETGPHSTLPSMKKGLGKCGFEMKDIKHVLLSHIHLDHAGAAWCFAEHGAKIYLHPLGFRHMNDPSKLLASAKMIYKEMMDVLWGTLKAIPAEQLISVEDNEIVTIGNLDFISHHTPGHAKHHIAWQLGNTIFTGDVAGVRINQGPVIPPCPPPDINVELWNASIDRLLAIPEIDAYYLTHGAKIMDCTDHMQQLKNTLSAYSEFIKPHFYNNTAIEEVMIPFQKFVSENLQEQGMSKQDALAYEAANPAFMSVAGLMRYWKKKESIPK